MVVWIGCLLFYIVVIYIAGLYAVVVVWLYVCGLWPPCYEVAGFLLVVFVCVMFLI